MQRAQTERDEAYDELATVHGVPVEVSRAARELSGIGSWVALIDILEIPLDDDERQELEDIEALELDDARARLGLAMDESPLPDMSRVPQWVIERILPTRDE